jgi:PAS domain S-box-containing protein
VKKSDLNLKYFAQLGTILILYFLAGKFGLSLAFLNASASPIWPPTGIALAAALLLGYRVWPAVLAGAFLVNFTTTGSFPASALIATGNCGEAIIGAWLVNRIAGGMNAFNSLGGIIRYSLAAVAGPAFSASIGILALRLNGLAAPTQILPVFFTWWTGDYISACMFTPLLVLFGRDAVRARSEYQIRFNRRKAMEAVALCAAVFVTAKIAFGGVLPAGFRNLPTEYICIPILIWACYRFGQRSALACVIIVAAISVQGTLSGFGPFSLEDQNLSLLLLQAYLGTISFISLFLGTLVAAKRKDRIALEASEIRFRQLAENIREVFYVHDARLQGMAYVSPAFEELWGITAQALYEKPESFLEAVHPEDRARVEESMGRRLQGETTQDEYRIVRPDGSVHWISDRAFPVKDSRGTVRRITGLALDITDAMAAEANLRIAEEKLRQSQKMEAVGRLAGSVAHDFNNLLTAINGYGEVLLSKLDVGDRNRVYVEEIRKAGDRAALVTQQLLAYSRKQAAAPAIMNLNNVVMDLEKMLIRLLGENVRFKVELGADIFRIMADSGQIAQVVMNLVLNARDAMPTGGKLRLSTFNTELSGSESDFFLKPQPGSYACLVIKDSGMGMTPEVKTHLFEPFYTTKEKFQGTGLGLSTVYGIVQQSRGGIRVVTEPDKGTAVYAYFPRNDEDWTRSEAAKPEGPGETAAIAQQGETILVVEDEENVRKLVRHVLTAQGYTVLEASGAREAMFMHENHTGPIHLLLTDIVMSGKSGREVAKEFMELRPGIRVVYMSGYTDDNDFRKELEKTNAHFLGKPFAPSRLVQKIREALSVTDTRSSASDKAAPVH